MLSSGRSGPRVKITGTVQSIPGMTGSVVCLRSRRRLSRPIGAVSKARWLGRDTIPGIEPGSTVAAEGRLAVRRGRATMFNPRYELTPEFLAVG